MKVEDFSFGLDANEFVTITIGIGPALSGVFKPVRGKSLPLKVNKRASAQTVLDEALKK